MKVMGMPSILSNISSLRIFHRSKHRLQGVLCTSFGRKWVTRVTPRKSQAHTTPGGRTLCCPWNLASFQRTCENRNVERGISSYPSWDPCSFWQGCYIIGAHVLGKGWWSFNDVLIDSAISGGVSLFLSNYQALVCMSKLFVYIYIYIHICVYMCVYYIYIFSLNLIINFLPIISKVYPINILTNSLKSTS